MVLLNLVPIQSGWKSQGYHMVVIILILIFGTEHYLGEFSTFSF